MCRLGMVLLLATALGSGLAGCGGGKTGPGTPGQSAASKKPTLLRGHTKSVTALSFSSDGKTLASSSDDGTIKLWDVATAKERASFRDKGVCVAFGRDPNILAAGSRTIKLLDVADIAAPKELAVLEWESDAGSAGCLAFSPDGQTLASGHKKGVKLWEVATHQKRSTLGGKEWVNAVAFSPDGKKLACVGWNGSVTLWDWTTGKLAGAQAGREDLKSVVFSPDGSTLAVAGLDDTLRLFGAEMVAGEPLKERSAIPHVMTCVAYSPDGKTLAGGGMVVRLMDPATGEVRTILSGGHETAVGRLAFSPDGKVLASGDPDGLIALWDVSGR